MSSLLGDRVTIYNNVSDVLHKASTHLKTVYIKIGSITPNRAERLTQTKWQYIFTCFVVFNIHVVLH